MTHYSSVLPTFIIGGAPRSGTTFLAATLSKHKHIKMANPLVPEPKVFLTHADSDEEYYRRYSAYFDEAHTSFARGEKSSIYFENEDACRRIQRFLFGVPLLFIVREPVARAYSNYLWTKKNGFEDLSFEAAIELEGKRESPLPPEKAYTRVYDYMIRGNYGTFAKRYYDAVGPDMVKFFVFEDMISERERVLFEIQQYIGVEPVAISELETDIKLSARDEGPPIRPETEKKLRERARPMVEEFVKVSGINVDRWGY